MSLKDGRSLIFQHHHWPFCFCSIFHPHLPTLSFTHTHTRTHTVANTQSCGLGMTFGIPPTTTQKLQTLTSRGFRGPTDKNRLTRLECTISNAKIQLIIIMSCCCCAFFCAAYRHVLGGTMFSGITASSYF